jgi:dimethylglycine dehydrogenase
VSVALTTASPTPVRSSPLQRRLANAGGTFSEADGWQVVHHFGDAAREADSARSGVGLCDLSHAVKWQVQGRDLGSALSSVLKAEGLSPGRAAVSGGVLVCCPSREQALAICDPPQPALISDLQEFARSGCLHLVDRTSGFARILVCGPQSPSVLRKLTPLDTRERIFPDLSCAWTPMAGVRVLLIRVDRRALAAYEILLSREYSEYLWQALSEAGQEYKLGFFGLDAARSLSGTA